jgi:hypothetical protein
LVDGQLSKSKFIKAKKSFPDQQVFDENSTKRGERNHRNIQERTSKLKYKHSETQRTTFEDIEKWQWRLSKHSLEKTQDFMQSTSWLEDYETTDRFGSYNCHFISYKLNSELQNLYFNSIFYWYLYLFIFIICGVMWNKYKF